MFARLPRPAAPLALSLLVFVTFVMACPRGQDVSPADPGGGERVCTQIGCIDGLQITLEKASPWPAGAYVFAFTLDGAPVRCSGALPLQSCDAGSSLRCDVADRVTVGESGCALAAAEQGFSDIHVDGTPAEVEVTITHDGAPLSQSKLTPEYTESRPNGPGCEPVCRSASAQLALL